MVRDDFTFLVGGKAGEGVKKAGAVAAQLFTDKGLYVFQMDDYMSLIRGGHNYSVVSTAERWIGSHYMNAHLVICFDKRSYDNHKNHVAEGGIVVYNSDVKGDMEGVGVPLTSEAKKYPNPSIMYGVGAVAILGTAVGLAKSEIGELIKREYPRGTEDNMEYANIICDIVQPLISNKFNLGNGYKKWPMIFGNQAIALGAIAGGLDIYFAYPMTPASSILHYLAAQAQRFNIAVIHPESEIAVMNMAVGSAFTGAKTMVGTSGGGFALMVEGFSLAGICEAPVLCVLSQRPGPATGVPTYTEQADLNFALSAGHGEFLRIVASPGNIDDAYFLTAELMNMIWRFQTPGILLTEKHLSESSMTPYSLDPSLALFPKIKMHQEGSYKRYLETNDGISPLLFPPSNELIKWNSYEHDDLGITTEEPDWIVRMHDKRANKYIAVENYLKNAPCTKIIYGEVPLNIFAYGSTILSVIEACRVAEINPTTVQPLFLNPLPYWELEKFKGQENIVVEQSLDGQFTSLLEAKAGLTFKKTIKRYDGRAFDPIELAEQIKEVL